MDGKAEPCLQLDESAMIPPRYGVPAPSGAAAFTADTASRQFAPGRGGARGPAFPEVDSKSSFLIAAVAENRAREIGNDVAVGWKAYVVLLDCDPVSVSRDLCDRLAVAVRVALVDSD